MDSSDLSDNKKLGAAAKGVDGLKKQDLEGAVSSERTEVRRRVPDQSASLPARFNESVSRDDIMYLQRTAGNERVNQFLESAVQRAPEAAAEAATTDAPVTDSELSFGDLQLRPLPVTGRYRYTGPWKNEEARRLLAKVAEAENSTERKELPFLLGVLRSGEERSKDDVAAVSDMSGEIGKRANRDRELKDTTQAYSRRTRDLQSQVKRVKAAYKHMLAGAKEVEKAKEQHNLSGAQQEEEAAQAKVTDINEKIETAKSRINKAIDIIGNVKHPMEIAKDVERFLKDFTIGYLVEDFYSADMREATEKLKAARKRVSTILTHIELLAIESAITELESRQANYEAELDNLAALTTTMEENEATLIRKLEDMGAGGERAATAIEGRDETSRSAQRALVFTGLYYERCTQILKDAQILYRGYASYQEGAGVDMHGNEPVTSDEAERAKVYGIAEDNKGVLRKLQTHAGTEANNAADGRDYLLGRSYMKKYEDMENSVKRAVLDRP